MFWSKVCSTANRTLVSVVITKTWIWLLFVRTQKANMRCWSTKVFLESLSRWKSSQLTLVNDWGLKSITFMIIEFKFSLLIFLVVMLSNLLVVTTAKRWPRFTRQTSWNYPTVASWKHPDELPKIILIFSIMTWLLTILACK